MSMSLAALPPELICCVVANIASPPTLCNLARCSRKLHLCTIPHLYRQVVIWETVRPEKQNGQLRSLASSLLRRADLASLVRHFTLHVGWTLGRSLRRPKERVSRQSDNVDQAFAENALSLSIEEKINCLEHFSPTHCSYYDLILTLLLPALLKVEKLVLGFAVGPLPGSTFYREHMIWRAACREKPFDVEPPFEALTVFVYTQNKINTRSTGFIASLLKLPAIQEISGGFEEPWRKDEEDNLAEVVPMDKNLNDLDSSSSPVTSLDLADYGLGFADLCHIFRAPKALKTLSYKVCLGPPPCLDFRKVRYALANQKNCLESLSLDCDPNIHRGGERLRSMPSFIDFNALKVFKTAAFYLATTQNGIGRYSLIDMFPPSLETLHLTRFHIFIIGPLEALEHLLGQKSQQQIPSLKRLILDETGSNLFSECEPVFARQQMVNPKFWRDLGDDAMKRLRRVAAAQRVSLDVTEKSTK
ncbi:hypothetical protein MMC22_009041 [Lobaria immixta]|nr:hypothetical protein [Lobaria immixta]